MSAVLEPEVEDGHAAFAGRAAVSQDCRPPAILLRHAEFTACNDHVCPCRFRWTRQHLVRADPRAVFMEMAAIDLFRKST
jgi:hypothetical protein